MAKNEHVNRDDDQTVIGNDSSVNPAGGSGPQSGLTNISGRNVSIDALASLADSLISTTGATPGDEAGETFEATDLPASETGSGIDSQAPSQIFGDDSLASLADSVLSATDHAALAAQPEGSGSQASSAIGSSIIGPPLAGTASAKSKKEAAPKKRNKFADKLAPHQKYIEWVCLGIVAVALAALTYLDVILIWTAIYAVGMVAIFYGIWACRETNTSYSVLLGCALAAVLTAVFCMWMEFARYGFDLKARSAKNRPAAAVMTQIHSDAVKTTTAA